MAEITLRDEEGEKTIDLKNIDERASRMLETLAIQCREQRFATGRMTEIIEAKSKKIESLEATLNSQLRHEDDLKERIVALETALGAFGKAFKDASWLDTSACVDIAEALLKEGG